MPGGWTSPPTVSYGQFQIKLPVFSEYTVFAHLHRLVYLDLVPGRLSSNSCSAALVCDLVLREEYAFLFQTFPEMTLLDRRRRRGAVLS